MRIFILLLLASATAYGQAIEVQTRPDAIYVETLAGDLTPIERVFFHIILHNTSNAPVDIESVRFSLTNVNGAALSGQYSGAALWTLFDSAIDRRRIEPTSKQSLTLNPDERKAISDIFFDFPTGFVGDSLTVEVEHSSGGKTAQTKTVTPIQRTPGFSARLPFEGVWYVASEHSFLDRHKRFLAESYAYDFLQIGAGGRSFQRDGTRNSDYYAYGKRVLAAKEGSIAFVRDDIVENTPGTPNFREPTGNVVIIDHGNNQFSVYEHLRPNSVSVSVGARVQAGDPIGEVGNSGDALEPQLHFHVMNKVDPNQADGIPVVFSRWYSTAFGRSSVAHETGMLPRGEFVSP